MKAKTAIVSIVAGAVAVGGGGFAAFQHMRGSSKPVEVVAVSTANYGMWDYDTSTISGTIVSRDSQKVDLNTEYNLTNVYVKEGDKVKKGDKLMEYDMTMPELQQEMEQLTHQLLEIRLDKENAELVKLNNGAPLDDEDSDAAGELEADVDTGDDEDDNTQSADVLIEEDGAESSADKAEDNSGAADQGSASGGDNGSSDAESPAPEQNAGDANQAGAEDVLLNGEDNTDTTGSEESFGGSDAGTGTGSSSIIEDDAFSIDQETVTPGTPTGTSADTAVPGAAEALNADNVKAAIADFINLANSIQSAKTRESAAGLIASAKVQWGELTKSDSEYKANGLAGGSVSIPQYQLSDLVQANTTEDERDQLFLSYAIVLDKEVRRQLDSIFSVVSSASGLTEETLKTAGADVVTAYDEYNAFVKSLKDYPDQSPQPLTRRTHNAMVTMFNALLINTDGAHTKYFEELSQLAAELLARNMIETESEPVTEAPYSGDIGGGDFGGGEGDDSYTAEERAEAIRAKKSEIAETKLQIRESDLKLKQYARTLDDKVIKATMDGVVQTAGTVEGGGSQDGFIVISGQKGLYVKGSLSEMNLDKVSVGDTVNGQDYDTGSAFTAEITEISPYPMDSSETDFFYFGNSGASASYYPFYAYIENSEGFNEDSSVDLTVDQSAQQSGTGLYIDSYYVRMDESGKYYAFVKGKDGKLEKRYVKAVPQDGGYVTQITGGLTNDDYVAFPYGKNTVEGADTVVVDSLGDTSLG